MKRSLGSLTSPEPLRVPLDALDARLRDARSTSLFDGGTNVVEAILSGRDASAQCPSPEYLASSARGAS